MWLFVGLGNPEDKYAKNRHNIGFMTVDEIAREPSFTPFKSKFDGLLSEGRLGGKKVALLKPQTYMNESGVCVGKVARFYKISPGQIVVFHDDLDLVPGKIKVKQGGGSGGHNGLKSIDAHLGTQNYWRVRMGIGHPGDRNRVTGYVLSDFSKEEQKWLPAWIEAVAKHAPLLVEDNKSDFMTNVAEEMNGI
ncbi:MAG: aminoacyl-tRNA hydrolase [Rhodospirillales bacterium]|nr:aminoacyl-tRNA hydrolase [Alphaproteobacteria bacterium]USO03514.1 MAG: aminoacyl-tRNA hydrolase [Rhodospirillales bacterium]